MRSCSEPMLNVWLTYERPSRYDDFVVPRAVFKKSKVVMHATCRKKHQKMTQLNYIYLRSPLLKDKFRRKKRKKEQIYIGTRDISSRADIDRYFTRATIDGWTCTRGIDVGREFSLRSYIGRDVRWRAGISRDISSGADIDRYFTRATIVGWIDVGRDFKCSAKLGYYNRTYSRMAITYETRCYKCVSIHHTTRQEKDLNVTAEPPEISVVRRGDLIYSTFTIIRGR